MIFLPANTPADSPIVARIAKRGLPHTSNYMNLKEHN